MRKFLAAAALSGLFGASAPLAAQEVDPFGAAPRPGSAQALERAAMLGEPGAEQAIYDWLDRQSRAPARDRAALYHRLCEILGVRGRNAERAESCAMEQRLAPRRGGGDDVALSAALARTPPIRVSGPVTLTLQENALGSKSAEVTVNGITLPWFMDTGAEISVLPQSNADRLRVRYVGGRMSVGTATADVEGRIGVIDRLQVGDATVENVPVFVLPDARLTVPGLASGQSFTISGILGLPVFVAFGRMAWIEDGRRLALGADAPQPAGETAPIFWHERGVGVPVRGSRGVAGAHLDTGANATNLFSGGRYLLSSGELATLGHRTVRRAGAGGMVEDRLDELPTWTFRLGSAPITLNRVTIVDDPDRIASVGSDALRQLRTLILDFETMTMAAEPRPTSNLPVAR